MSKYWKHNDNLVDISNDFIYEVDLFCYQDKSWNLEDTRKYSSDKFIKDVVEFQKFSYDTFKIFKFTTLLSAPLNWLQENAIEIEYETPKEKRKRKLLEKENDKRRNN